MPIPIGGIGPFQIITDSLTNFHTFLRKYIRILQRVFSNILHIGLNFAILCVIDGEMLKTVMREGIIKFAIRNA